MKGYEGDVGDVQEDVGVVEWVCEHEEKGKGKWEGLEP